MDQILYVFPGDFWHHRGVLPVETLNRIISILRPWDIPMLMIPGNHDQVCGVTLDITRSMKFRWGLSKYDPIKTRCKILCPCSLPIVSKAPSIHYPCVLRSEAYTAPKVLTYSSYLLLWLHSDFCAKCTQLLPSLKKTFIWELFVRLLLYHIG